MRKIPSEDKEREAKEKKQKEMYVELENSYRFLLETQPKYTAIRNRLATCRSPYYVPGRIPRNIDANPLGKTPFEHFLNELYLLDAKRLILFCKILRLLREYYANLGKQVPTFSEEERVFLDIKTGNAMRDQPIEERNMIITMYQAFYSNENPDQLWDFIGQNCSARKFRDAIYAAVNAVPPLSQSHIDDLMEAYTKAFTRMNELYGACATLLKYQPAERIIAATYVPRNPETWGQKQAWSIRINFDEDILVSKKIYDVEYCLDPHSHEPILRRGHVVLFFGSREMSKTVLLNRRAKVAVKKNWCVVRFNADFGCENDLLPLPLNEDHPLYKWVQWSGYKPEGFPDVVGLVLLPENLANEYFEMYPKGLPWHKLVVVPPIPFQDEKNYQRKVASYHFKLDWNKIVKSGRLIYIHCVSHDLAVMRIIVKAAFSDFIRWRRAHRRTDILIQIDELQIISASEMEETSSHIMKMFTQNLVLLIRHVDLALDGATQHPVMISQAFRGQETDEVYFSNLTDNDIDVIRKNMTISEDLVMRLYIFGSKGNAEVNSNNDFKFFIHWVKKWAEPRGHYCRAIPDGCMHELSGSRGSWPQRCESQLKDWRELLAKDLFKKESEEKISALTESLLREAGVSVEGETKR